MRFIFVLPLVFFFNIVCYAESYTQYNSASRTAIVLYTPDAQGFYHKQTNVSVNVVDNIEAQYAFDKKNKNLYVATPYGNFVVTLTDSKAKLVKKDKSIPQVKEKDINTLVLSVNNSLDEKFARLNLERERFLADSIEDAKEQARLAAIEKARIDSINLAKHEVEITKYKSNHNWRWLPITLDKDNTSKYSNSIDLKCDLCEESVYSYNTDSIFTVAIHNDTIYSMTYKEGYIDNGYYHIHRYKVPTALKSSSKYLKHLEVYRDSLMTDKFDNELIEIYNYEEFSKYVDRVKSDAPYGFFDGWGWDNEYSSISFYFTFTNLNKRTIKYIDVYWKVTNGVGDVRKTGHFKGTGPLEQYDSAKWNWDYSGYYVAGDASEMEITKVIITYMNGQQQILTKKMIKFN